VLNNNLFIFHGSISNSIKGTNVVMSQVWPDEVNFFQKKILFGKKSVLVGLFID